MKRTALEFVVDASMKGRVEERLRYTAGEALARLIVALRYTRGPTVFATVLSVATFDVLFVPPQGTFTVDDAQYLLTFGIMLAVGLIISRLTENVRRQAQEQANLAAAAQTERLRSTLLA